MTKLGPYEVHPFADQFPLIDGEEFDNLVDDIKNNGLIEPITITHDKKILVDGRNRYRACEIANVEPKIHVLGRHYTEEQILKYIVSKNVHRRQLTREERIALASDLKKRLEVEAAKRRAQAAGQPRGEKQSALVGEPPQENERKSREQAAKAFDVSGYAVQQFEAVKRDTPELVEKVLSKEMSLDAAHKVGRPKRDERRAAKTTKPEPEPEPEPEKKTPKIPQQSDAKKVTKRELEKQLKEQRDRMEDWVFKVEAIGSASPFRSQRFELHKNITPEERKAWAERLKAARTPITTAINKLKEGSP